MASKAKADKRDVSDSDDESDQDYQPDGDGGNVSEEEESGDAESSGGEENEGPVTKRQRKDTAATTSGASKIIDADAIWADFKKDSESTTKPKEQPVKPVAAAATATTAAKPAPSAKPQSSLAGILGKINKKDKVSVLEKSRLDWNSFKKAEGIEEDLQTHNKGKDGFLEKRDFLERTDVRQFELEKAMRSVKRSNR